jgi:DNA sulfur modification protein DndD
MILQRLTLHNVGVFGGTQSLELTPPDAEHPVVLIGALNGGGKTTLLGALQLSLYGSRAQGIARTRKGYERHLQELIHRKADPAEGAFVELSFERRIDGRAVHYQIRRSWRMVGGAIEESFQVYRDGEPDELAATHWDDTVDAFLPARLSHLFFFDGEQIERMADEAEATHLLATAFQSLLGLDLVARLREDLAALEKRKQFTIRGPADREKIRHLEAEVKAAEEKCQKAHDRIASENTRIEQKERQLEDLRDRFRAEGGDHFLERDQRKAARDKKAAELATREHRFRELLAGPAPLLLVPELLDELLAQAELEEQARRERIVAEAEIARDEKVLNEIRNALPKDVFAMVQDALEKHRPRRELIDSPVVLAASEGFSDRLRRIVEVDLPPVARELATLKKEIIALRDELTEIDRSLAAVPDEDAIAAIQRDILRVEQEIASLKMERDAHFEALRVAEFDLSLRQRTLDREYQKHVEDWEISEHDRRIIEHIPKVQVTLETFRTQVVARHVGSLENAIVESFQHLARKPKLLHSVRINPTSFQIALLDATGSEVPFQSFSAGERQLLATAILWALAKVSGRPVPLIIDTPLGRLDSHHRSHIVQRYFPAASHQVILLSTDEEIVGRYLEMIQPFTGRQFRIEFQQEQGHSVIEPGYFQL